MGKGLISSVNTMAWRPYVGSLLAMASALLFAAAAFFDYPLTRLMSLHMLVQIPMLVLSGALLQRALVYQGWGNRSAFQPFLRLYYHCNELGLPGLILVSFVGAYWMIPKALDDVLLSPSLALTKYIGLVLAGIVFQESWSRSHLVIRLFFMGNLCWMMAIAGIIYQENPERLCNFYLQSDQEIAGIGLVVMACVLPSLWFLSEIKAIMHFLRQQ